MKPLLTAINNAYTMQEHGTQYKRLLRQLISLLADPSSGLARGKVHAMITGSGTDVTFAAIKQARKSARDNGAGMPAPKQEFSRIRNLRRALKIARWRFTECVCELNKGSIRNARAGKVGYGPHTSDPHVTTTMLQHAHF
jgi:hypothetical protein